MSRSGALGSREREQNDNLHPGPEPRMGRRPQPDRPPCDAMRGALVDPWLVNLGVIRCKATLDNMVAWGVDEWRQTLRRRQDTLRAPPSVSPD